MNAVEKVIVRQKEDERPDSWIAKRLGVSTQRWQFLRTHPETIPGLVPQVLRGMLNSKLATEKEIIDFIRGTSNG